MDRKIGLGSNGVLTSKDDQPQATVLRHEWDVPRMIAAYGLQSLGPEQVRSGPLWIPHVLLIRVSWGSISARGIRRGECRVCSIILRYVGEFVAERRLL